jgi:hypothetical protein
MKDKTATSNVSLKGAVVFKDLSAGGIVIRWKRKTWPEKGGGYYAELGNG